MENRLRSGRQGRIHVLAFVALSFVLAGTILASTTTASGPARASGQPALGIYSEGYPQSLTDAEGATSQLGRPAQIVHWYAEWTGDMSGWAESQPYVQKVLDAGATPMITWEAWDGANDGTNPASLQAIVRGEFDGYIDSWAQGAAALGNRPLYLRIFHEMNDPYEASDGAGYPWSVAPGNRFGNRPQDLAAAWQHIVNRFRAAGASNVRWIFNSDDDIPNNPIPAGTYPGDRYVDYVGFDAYDDSGTPFAGDYQAITRLSSRPVLIGEMGATHAGFVQGIAAGIRSGSYPALQALVWFDEGDTALARNPSVKAALAGLAT